MEVYLFFTQVTFLGFNEETDATHVQVWSILAFLLSILVMEISFRFDHKSHLSEKVANCRLTSPFCV